MKKLYNSKTRASLTMFMLILGGVFATDSASAQTYFINANDKLQRHDGDIIEFANETILGSEGTTTWVRVTGTRIAEGRITILGTVHLILTDGSHLDASLGGICATGDNTLIIYSQFSGTGQLTANGLPNAAGIGGSLDNGGGTIVINGGIIRARGGDAADVRILCWRVSASAVRSGASVSAGAGAGIGGGGGNRGNNGFSGGNITINRGNVRAIGGNAAGQNDFDMHRNSRGGGGGAGAGIGGGGGAGGSGIGNNGFLHGFSGGPGGIVTIDSRAFVEAISEDLGGYRDSKPMTTSFSGGGGRGAGIGGGGGGGGNWGISSRSCPDGHTVIDFPITFGTAGGRNSDGIGQGANGGAGDGDTGGVGGRGGASGRIVIFDGETRININENGHVSIGL